MASCCEDTNGADLSLNELMSLSRLAARGAGYPWGIADEAASACRWLAERGWPAAQYLDHLLTLHDHTDHTRLRPVLSATRWTSSTGRLCPLYTGTALLDFASLQRSAPEIQFPDVVQPILLLPFAARASRLGTATLSLRWGAVRFSFAGGRLLNHDDGSRTDSSAAADEAASIAISTVYYGIETIDDDAMAAAPIPADVSNSAHSRVTLDADLLARLKSLAARTYAPATEQSRLLGAGAGTSDND